MEKIQEKFNPVYNDVEQVKMNAEYMLGEKVTDAKIAIVIGHNGRNFVSSTDWRITTESGAKRILPFSIRPQYPNFIECVAGVMYDVFKRSFIVIPEPAWQEDRGKKAVSVVMDGKTFQFAAGEALKIYVEPNSKFIATDCLVKCENNETGKTYRIITDENTIYGWCDDKGHISRL